MEYYCRGCQQQIHWGKIIRPQVGQPYHLRWVLDTEWRDDPKARDNSPLVERTCGPVEAAEDG